MPVLVPLAEYPTWRSPESRLGGCQTNEEAGGGDEREEGRSEGKEAAPPSDGDAAGEFLDLVEEVVALFDNVLVVGGAGVGARGFDDEVDLVDLGGESALGDEVGEFLVEEGDGDAEDEGHVGNLDGFIGVE
eukprot:CAMPEP_0197426172 /NCGR_PEP_ID=MMETSP1170-20131217/33963_1 /TAXON_ID=54406 /ORGANISM="Sarcinochrysis sp, Strain CCMP770" /LENGTH=131 /DNA_ID=CAMNT_0042953793 /DNA_START=179 /DNA_END=571 /DNA_ORIENTATION=+